jgi:hypothetical protein
MKEKEKNRHKEKIKKAFRRVVLAGLILASTLTSSYPAAMHYRKYTTEAFPERYRYEVSLIEEGDRYNQQYSMMDYTYYKKAMELIKEKQDKIGEGKDLDLDFLRAYSVYSMAKAPPEPEYAEPYLLEARELAKKYYEIWKHETFLDLQAAILENLGYIYFDAAEKIRKGELYLVLLSNSTSAFHGVTKDKLLLDSDALSSFRYKYKIKEVIDSNTFVKIIHYYSIAKRYYKEYLKFCEENNLEKIVEKYTNVSKIYKETNRRVLSHLQTIDEILSKYDPNYKKEETKENQIKGPTEKKKKK